MKPKGNNYGAKFHGLQCQICRIKIFLALGFSEDYIEDVLNMCE